MSKITNSTVKFDNGTQANNIQRNMKVAINVSNTVQCCDLSKLITVCQLRVAVY